MFNRNFYNLSNPHCGIEFIFLCSSRCALLGPDSGYSWVLKLGSQHVGYARSNYHESTILMLDFEVSL